MSTLAVVAPGAMGAAIAARLSASSAGTIFTNLDGRSEATIQRARASGMQHASWSEIALRAAYIYSIVPPKDALAIAESIIAAHATVAHERLTPLVFVDCNAVNPESMKRMAALFEGTGITLLDGVVIGTPPTAEFNPAIYVSADPKDMVALDEFTRVSNGFGLNVRPLKGEGAGIGDASALKMAHSGIVKGTIGLFTTMILAANAASPSTASGLAHALDFSQPALSDLLIRLLPEALPKAYRFVGEMEQVGGFVAAHASGAHVSDVASGPATSPTFDGLAQIFARVAGVDANEGTEGDVLLRFVEQAKEARARAGRG
ncbi:Nad-binding phosphogluconate dehydrogenase-like protein [Mycena sanguinolenta]|uniref:Nad-binding phosphogluconate dehydrogenase-like protein n=1 Tax=Mycena sanguinolenta TaxID=230812 RepID=A0A8H6X6K5_9AGAR|nr:Nad-binding phosphogluconate dehydrogenase-like protein [Mycena sanguinolenta]